MAERILNTYTEWQDPESALGEDDIREFCCTDTEVDPCSEVGRVSPWSGVGNEPPDDLPDDPRRMQVHVELVGPAGPCGELHEEWTDRNSCCAAAEPLVWDDVNSIEVIADNSWGDVRVVGDYDELHWKLRGQGFYTDQGRRYREAITYGPSLRIFTGDACGPCLIEVTDGCTVLSGYFVRSATGEWVSLSAEEMLAHGSQNVKPSWVGSGVDDAGDNCSSTQDFYMVADSNGYRYTQKFYFTWKVSIDSNAGATCADVTPLSELMSQYESEWRGASLVVGGVAHAFNLIDGGAAIADGRVPHPDHAFSWQSDAHWRVDGRYWVYDCGPYQTDGVSNIVAAFDYRDFPGYYDCAERAQFAIEKWVC